MENYEKIHHVSLNVRDLGQSAAFYDKLGFKRIGRPDFGILGAWFEVAEGYQLHLIEDRKMKMCEPPENKNHFSIWVRSYKDQINFLDGKGIEHYDEPNSPAGFPQIYVEDPEGNQIEFDADTIDS